MSSHESPPKAPKTPPPNPEIVQAHLESQQSTNPNRGTSTSGQLLVKVQYVYRDLLFSAGRLLYSSRKDLIKSWITVDMKKRKHCSPEDMVQFLLALCCQDDSSTAAVSRDETLDRRYNDCLREVTSIADSPDLRERLES